MVGARSATAKATSIKSPKFDRGIGQEAVLRHFQVQRGGALANAPRRIVMRAVAWAEPAIVLTLARQRYAAEVGADTENDEPLLVHDALRVRLRVTKGLGVNRHCGCDLIRVAVPHKDGLVPPLHRETVTDGNRTDIKLKRRKREHILMTVRDAILFKCSGGGGVCVRRCVRSEEEHLKMCRQHVAAAAPLEIVEAL